MRMHFFLFEQRTATEKKGMEKYKNHTKRMERATEYGCEFCILEDRFFNVLFCMATPLSICMENIGDQYADGLCGLNRCIEWKNIFYLILTHW